MANIDFPSNPTTGQQYSFAGVTYQYSSHGVWTPGGGAGGGIIGGSQGVPQGRLTVQSGIPISVTSAAGSGSLFYTPYNGNLIPIWNGTNFVMKVFTELVATLNDTLKNPGPILATKINDWFVWYDETVPATPVMRLSHGPDWTDNTNRSAGTTLIRLNGLLVNVNAITNGPGAQRGTYVGTTRADSNGGFVSYVFGAAGLGGVQGRIGVWNQYNRASIGMTVTETSTYAYGAGVYRYRNNSPLNSVTFVSGIPEDSFRVDNFQLVQNTATSWSNTAIALDTLSNIIAGISVSSTPFAQWLGLVTFTVNPGIVGYHELYATDYVGGTPACTFYGGSFMFQWRC